MSDAVTRKRKLLLAGKGPVLLDTVTYHLVGHSPSDPGAYRSKERLTLWQGADAIETYGAYLLKHRAATQAEMDGARAGVVERLAAVVELVTGDAAEKRASGPFIESVMPMVRKKGTDLSIATLGATLYRALEAVEVLEERYGVSTELVGLRFINPLHYTTLLDSVKKTGRLVLASDGCERGSFLHTVATNVTHLAFDWLDAPVAVVGSRNWITPAAEVEELFFPQKEWLVDTVHERVLPLQGHACTTVQTTEELLRRARLGA